MHQRPPPTPLWADFSEFLKVIQNQKERAAQFDDESDMGMTFFVVVRMIL
jgi:hypothetical protein